MAEPTTLTLTPLPSTILYRAADITDVRGLCKDDWIEPEPGVDDAAFEEYDADTCPVCLLAAINIAAGRYHAENLSDVTLDAAEAVAAFLGLDHLVAEADCPHDAFVEVLGTGWNDAEERTENDVVRVLRGAAKREAAAGR